jgi:hypothetical protein
MMTAAPQLRHSVAESLSILILSHRPIAQHERDKAEIKYDDHLMLTVMPDGPHKSGRVRSCFEISAQITPK